MLGNLAKCRFGGQGIRQTARSSGLIGLCLHEFAILSASVVLWRVYTACAARFRAASSSCRAAVAADCPCAASDAALASRPDGAAPSVRMPVGAGRAARGRTGPSAAFVRCSRSVESERSNSRASWRSELPAAARAFTSAHCSLLSFDLRPMSVLRCDCGPSGPRRRCWCLLAARLPAPMCPILGPSRDQHTRTHRVDELDERCVRQPLKVDRRRLLGVRQGAGHPVHSDEPQRDGGGIIRELG